MVTKVIDSLPKLLAVIDEYSDHLVRMGTPLDPNGFPVLGRESFLDEWPDAIVPYYHRRAPFVTRPDRTVLCFYDSDRNIYPRLERVLEDVQTYQGFLGVIGSDVTVTADMDMEWQAAIMLLNALFTAVLAAHGVRVVANLRAGSEETIQYLSYVPMGVMCASGFLGCARTGSPHDYSYTSKILRVMPSGLLLYGRHDPEVERQLDEVGVSYRSYPDARSLHFAGRGRKGRGQVLGASWPGPM